MDGLIVECETDGAVFLYADSADREWRVSKRTGRVTSRTFINGHYTRWLSAPDWDF